MSEVRSTFRLNLGDAAPEFSLPDADGIAFSLSDIRGPSGAMVVFVCNHCPYVIHLAKPLAALADELRSQGVHTVAISSNDVEKYPQDGPEMMKVFAQQSGWNFPYLYDASQDIALAYGAACTPDFFLFDHNGRLFYTGQFDDSRPKNGQIADGRDLRDAAQRMLAGESPPAKPYPSSGCSIKWKPGHQPEWWASGH
jgi:peroxiredoxin